MTTREPILVGMSGKISSGKDSIGEAIMNKLVPSHVQLSFGQVLKTELNFIIEQILKNTNYSFDQMKVDMGMEEKFRPQGTEVLNALVMDKRDGLLVDAWTKTPGVRVGAQVMATGIRREQNENYWIDQVENLIESHPDEAVLVTDVRFPNELDLIHRLGGYSVRLDVDPEVQRTRLFNRDGHSIIPQHISETALDDRDDFFIRVDNSTRPFDEVVEEICSRIR